MTTDPTPDLPSTDASTAEVPATDMPVVDAPVAEAPATDIPATDAPVDLAAPPEPMTEDAPALMPRLPETPALPEAPRREPLRPLVPGTFLRLEFEIREVLARGLTNFYLADAGDFGQSLPRLIAERALPAAVPTAPPANVEVNAEGLDETAVNAAAIGGAMLEEATLEASAAVPEEDALAADAPLQAALFPPGERFVQDDREYLVFEFGGTTALQDYREPTHDGRYLQFLDALARGLQELAERGLCAALTRETLRVTDEGALRYWGFVDALPPHDAPVEAGNGHEHPGPLAQLQSLNNFLLKHVFAESSTLRLDDRFGSLPLSEEVKQLARHLDEAGFADMGAVVAAIVALYQPGRALRAEAALLSDVGRERELNEDAGLICRVQRAAHLGSYGFDLYAVSDGMGGHEGGEVASDLTLAALQRALAERAGIDWNDNVAVRAALQEAIEAVNNEVVALTESPRYRAMRAKPGATLTFAVRLGARVFVGNVGDSRAYKWSAARGLERITKDHSYVQSLIDAGQISEEDAWDHPDGSIITAHIGYPKLKTRDVFLRLLAPGDKLLIVSDGVVDMLRDSEIVVFMHEDDPATVCHDLVGASNVAGGADNITALCVAFA